MGLFSSALGSIGMLAGGPVGSQIGSSVGGYLDDKQKADYQWKRQKRMFNWQTQWEEEKMRNAIQWQREDMKKAGINPLVAGITGGATGSGAPNPSAPAFNSSSAVDYSKGLTNLRSIDQMDRNLDIAQQNANANEKLANARSGKEIEETKWIEPKAKADIQNKNTNTLKQTAETGEIKASQDLILSKLEMQEMDNAIKEIEKLVNTGKFGTALAYIDRLAETGSNIVNVISPLKSALANKNKRDVEEYITTYRNMNGNPVKHRRVTSR